MFINTVTTDAYRGAGRPEATDAIERLMDTIARELHLDPAEMRWRNFLRDLSRPTCVDLLYDSGNYPAAVDKALALVGYEALRAEQQRLRAQGRYLGLASHPIWRSPGLARRSSCRPAWAGGRAVPFVSSPRAWRRC